MYPTKNYMYDASTVHTKSIGRQKTSQICKTVNYLLDKKIEDPHDNAKSHLQNKNYTHQFHCKQKVIAIYKTQIARMSIVIEIVFNYSLNLGISIYFLYTLNCIESVHLKCKETSQVKHKPQVKFSLMCKYICILFINVHLQRYLQNIYFFKL